MNKKILILLMGTVFPLSLKAQDSTKEVKLKEVSVEGRNVTLRHDHANYIPTQKQKNAANSGIGLLFNLMIPQLEVDRLKGTVKSMDNSKLSIYKDGQPVSIEEINNIRPKDVLRVEFYPTAKDKFPGEEKVVNFIMRKYKSGGYVDLRTETRFLNEQGAYKAIASIDHQKMHYTLMAGTNYQHDHARGAEKEETYALNPTFTKWTTPQNQASKNNSYYGLLRATRKTQSSTLQAEAILTQSQNSVNQQGLTSYSEQRYPDNPTYSDQTGKNLSVTLHPYFYTKLNERQTLKGDFNLNYGHNTYDRNYMEGNVWTPVNNYAQEDQYSCDAKLTYIANFKHNNGISIPIMASYQNNTTHYGKAESDPQELYNSDVLLWINYWHVFFKKLNVNMQAGFDLNSYRVNTEPRVTKIWPRPGLYINYHINGHNSVNLSTLLGNSIPSISVLNQATQRINHYEVSKGNSDSKCVTMANSFLSYDLYTGPLSMSAYIVYAGLLNTPKWYHTQEGTDLVHTVLTDGDFHDWRSGIGATVALLNKSLYFRLNIDHYFQKSTGLYATTHRQWACYFNSSYYIKSFSFTGYFKSATSGLVYTPLFYDNRCDYGLIANWNHRGLFIEMGCSRLFDKHPYTNMYFDYGIYKLNNKDYSYSNGKQIYIKLSYNFDFGRKIKHEDVDVAPAKASSILKL